jgi:hypothetical protein
MVFLEFQSLLGNDNGYDYINNKLNIFMRENLLFFHASRIHFKLQ